MGLRYLGFRISHELKRKTGMLQRKFPVAPKLLSYVSLQQWKQSGAQFFFNDKSSLQVPKKSSPELEAWFKSYRKGKLLFFGSTFFDLGPEYNWVTNPDTGFVYDNQKHWTQIADYSKEAGDIKYVWEKSRFSFLYNVIRYDYHFEHDCSGMVFKEILSWIDHNPINCGPNYRCSQEISLRVFNWIFALYYYKNSPALTEVIFQKIMHAIYWQIKHVYSNINFSRIAVRNNHAITETMGLYLFGILFPFFPEAGTWKKKGKKWFEAEVAYQVYTDGTFLQFSMNYHRVVIQLLTWGIRLSELNNEVLDKVVKERATASLHFLFNCMNLKNGNLPNYGANDGALFFPLNDRDVRDYRPQLQALSAVLHEGAIEENDEDQYWYGINEKEKIPLLQKQGIISYPVGGFYLLREKDTFSFIRCGNHKDRPSQADNLHLDLWINEKNILKDAGSYKYNADEKSMRYFFGTASHNTVMLGDNDQMKKGGRFIWYYWTQAIRAEWTEYEEYYEFKGAIKAFQQLNNNIVHNRTVRKYKAQWKWEVIDEVKHDTSVDIRQYWHPAPDENLQISFTAFNENNDLLSVEKGKGWYSPKYSVREESDMFIFSTDTKRIQTIIEVKPFKI
ncbi:MAG TPA: alginate lyase family protein [Chitinophagaceae bacterium]